MGGAAGGYGRRVDVGLPEARAELSERVGPERGAAIELFIAMEAAVRAVNAPADGDSGVNDAVDLVGALRELLAFRDSELQCFGDKAFAAVQLMERTRAATRE